MRRATWMIAVVLVFGTFVAPRAQAQGDVGFLVNGVGLIDYGRRPDFKVGTWTKYHVTGHSSGGLVDDYTVTIGIGGEERFWGEDCFWVETVTEKPGAGGSKSAPFASVVGTLMSYAVYDDSLPFPHMQFYMRKTITESDANGRPVETLARRPAAAIKQRNRKETDLKWYIDTLGVDTLNVAKGSFVCRKIHIRQDLMRTVDRGDSTHQNENKEDRDSYLSRRVPLTGIVREDINSEQLGKAWLVGRSKDAPSNILEHSSGQAVLVDYGDDYKSSLLPPERQRSIREQLAGSAPHEATPSRPAKARKSH